MKLSQVGLQLFTLRDHLKTPADIAGSLKKVREIGYTAVQVSGMGRIDEAELVQILDGEGLTLCATHEPGPKILDETEQVIERLKKLKCSITAYPFPAGVDFSDIRSVDMLIAKLDAAGAKMQAEGLRLTYHNHGNEFHKIGGKTVLDRIYDETRPENLGAELDTYWVQYGGGNPVVWCEKMAGRQPIIHLKDYTCTPENQAMFCEVGYGNLDFPAIIAAAEKGGCEWFVVEQDKTPGDPFDSIRMSFEYIRQHLVSE